MSAASPLVSVIVPFYGVEDYLAECLDSILAQTEPDFECILVDDGSKDRSIDVATAYAARDPRVKVVRQQNQGLGPARNTGVRHATGEYLMFVDSDDLLAPRALELLVTTLRRSGSDFAVGNAWRFTRELGTWGSWTHQLPCAEDRTRTNVREFPALVRDRMAWNKLYRRSFWDAHGYEFPAIRYEDFPVTLRAHLDAEAVDVVSRQVYLWRDRESGDSITQQVFDAHNATDRIASANLVLDLLDRPGLPAEVVEDVHAYLVEVDLVALSGALAQAGWNDRARLETLVRRLALRLHPQAPGRVPRLSYLVHRALRGGDFEFVRALARWREAGDRRALLDDLRRHPHQIPPVLWAITPRRRRPVNPLRRPLEVTMTGAVEEAGRLVVNADIKLRPQFNLSAQLSARLVSGRREVPLPVEPARKWVSLKARIVITPEDVAALGGEPAELIVDARRYALHWWGPVAVPEPAELPPVLPLPDGTHAVAARLDDTTDHLMLGLLVGVVTGEGRKTGEGTAELRLSRPAAVSVRRPGAGPDVACASASGAVVLDASAIVAGDPPDNPVLKVSRRELVTDAPGGRLYLTRFPGAIEHDGVRVRVVPHDRGYAQLLLTHP